MANHTRFRRKVDAQADRVVELQALEASARLSSKAFLATACKNAGIDGKRARAVRDDVMARREVLPAVARFVDQMARGFGGNNYPSPPTRTHKIMAAFGPAGIETFMSEAKASVLELVAAAVLVAHEREPWSGIDDAGKHAKELAETRAAVAAGYQRLRESYCPTDVAFEVPDALKQPDMARDGWARTYFRNFVRTEEGEPAFDFRTGEWGEPPLIEHRIFLSDVSWPERLVEFVLAERRAAAEPPAPKVARKLVSPYGHDEARTIAAGGILRAAGGVTVI